MSFCSCSWSSSYSLWCFFAVITGSVFSLPIHEEGPSAPPPNAFSSLEPRLTAPTVASPAPTRLWWDLPLRKSRPWSEVKSRRGAPRRINTQGFACPNQQCPYCGITEAHIHALVGDGKHGQADQIQTFRGPACRTTFSARRDTPLYRLKTPSHQVAVVRITCWPKDWTLPPPNGSQGYRQATITTWMSRAGEHARTLHEHFFCTPASVCPVGRTADEAAQRQTGPLAVVGHRPLHPRFSPCSI
jgi:hypothetical protein